LIERCHNSEIRTHILENRVLQLVRDVLCDPDKLRRCIEVPAHSERVERKKLRRRLTTFDKRIKEIEAERRRIINLQATGELGKDAYINAGASSGQASMLTSVLLPQARQVAKSERTPRLRMLPSVIGPIGSSERGIGGHSIGFQHQ